MPTLRGRTVVNVFFESSTRTASSFELAAKRLSADTMSLKAAGSSVDKGESLKDTMLTLDAYGPDVVVMRHAARRGAAARDALDAAPRSSTPATASTSTRPRACSTSTRCSEALGRIEGVHVAIVGDVLHSRVARSQDRAAARLRRRRHARRAAHADAARHRGDRRCGLARHRRDRRRRRRLRAAHAARAHAGGRGLRAQRCASTPRAGASRRRACGPARSSCTRGR